jgi:23S rRNA (adenine2503-C2)-methyltransferase
MTRDISSMDMDELHGLMAELNQPAFRAGQLFEWLHRKGAASFNEMTNLPKALRENLETHCRIAPCREINKQVSKDGTVKYLFELESGGTTPNAPLGGASPGASGEPVYIESVLMEYKHGHSLCLSTQAGCRMGCFFCASGEGGLVRNLTAGEICAQVYEIQKAMDEDKRVSSIVLMGCGEPLDNFGAVLRFIQLITHPKGANIGARHITLSTCGLTPQIRALADMALQITLAVSLHGPTDEIRKGFMPVASRYPLDELLDACRYYADKTRRRITFEYALAAGINDAEPHARALAARLKGMLCHVNLIPINKKTTSDGIHQKFIPTPRRQAEAFAEILNKSGIPATIRRSLGSDIAAACGQLRGDFCTNRL